MSKFYEGIETAFRERVEAIEGEPPTDDMIREHGQRLVCPDGKTTLAWKGLPVVEWDAFPIRWGNEESATITFRATPQTEQR